VDVAERVCDEQTETEYFIYRFPAQLQHIRIDTNLSIILLYFYCVYTSDEFLLFVIKYLYIYG